LNIDLSTGKLNGLICRAWLLMLSWRARLIGVAYFLKLWPFLFSHVRLAECLFLGFEQHVLFCARILYECSF